MKRFLATVVLALLFIMPAYAQVSSEAQEMTDKALNGDFEGINYFLQAKEYFESKNAWDDNTKGAYLYVVRVLSEVCSRNGWATDRKNVLEEALSQFEAKDLMVNSIYKRTILMMLAGSYFQLQDYDRALTVGNKALSAYESANDYSLDYVILCSNLSELYQTFEEFLPAKLFIDNAIESYKTLVNSGLTDGQGLTYLHLLNIRGSLLMKLGKRDEATQLFEEIISSDVDGSEFYKNSAANNLAVLYINIGQYDKAISLLNGISSHDSNAVFNKLQNLLVAELLSNDSTAAKETLSKANNYLATNIVGLIRNVSKSERDAAMWTYTDALIAFNNMVAANDNSAAELAFDNNLSARSIKLYTDTYLHLNGSENGKRLKAIRKRLSMKMISDAERDSLSIEQAGIEKRMLQSEDFIQYVDKHCGAWKEIKQKLNDNEAIVLFTIVPAINNYGISDFYIGAFVADKSYAIPKLIRICKDSDIEDLFYRAEMSLEFISSAYSDETSRKIYDLLWDSIEKEIGENKRIYFATVGQLATLNIASLTMPSGKRLDEWHDMVLVSSPAMIGNIREQASNAKTISAIGAANVNLSTSLMKKQANSFEYFNSEGDIPTRGATTRGSWSDLPGAQQEIDNIITIAKKNGYKCSSFTDDKATEECVKGLSGAAPSILHFATHGYCISTKEQQESNAFTAANTTGIVNDNNRMQWAGLILAGANNAWKGNPIPPQTEDGILTANEISQLDLTGTRLVVLSACETARGYFSSYDGLQGLQRAFKTAGAGTIVMTLWEVPDDITSMFMTEFYRNYFTGASTRDAIRAAQRHLIANGASDPYYWAAFVVMD